MTDGEKTANGLVWSLLEMAGTRGAQFFIGILLARLVMPEDFGMLGILTVFIAISQTLVDSGFSQALIREGDVSAEDRSTIFLFNLTVALVRFVLLVLLSNPIAAFFGKPQLAPLVRVSSLVLVFAAASLIAQTQLVKRMDFRTLARISFTSALAAGIIAVVMAAYGFGAWSLVANLLFTALFQAILLFLHQPWLPLPVFRWKAFRRMYGFGSKLMVSGLIDTISGNLYYVLIGRLFSPASLGYFTHADRNLDAFATNVTAAVQRVTYPVLSTMNEENDRLRANYRRIIRFTMLVFPASMLGLAAVAEPLYLTLFGEKWLEAVPYFRLLCLAGMLYPVHAINLNLLKVKGRSDLYLRLEIIKKILFAANVAISIRWGITGLLVGAIVDTFLCFFINSHFSGKLIAYGFREQMADVFPFLGLSVAMGAAVLAVQKVLAAPAVPSGIVAPAVPSGIVVPAVPSGLAVPAPLQLLLLVPLGGILYALGVFLFRGSDARALIDVIRGLLARRRHP